ncbi:IS1 family transposase [Pantoea brenneri]|uniref:IS1 family transposase n=1 Tax=Pantoea brenneri TaxID=472694 RepID=UPI00210FE5B8|nr:IS1 family transposase [Pantoea brenneri]
MAALTHPAYQRRRLQRPFLRQHLARLGRKSLSFSKSVELHDKVIGHYLNIKHYQ